MGVTCVFKCLFVLQSVARVVVMVLCGMRSWACVTAYCNALLAVTTYWVFWSTPHPQVS